MLMRRKSSLKTRLNRQDFFESKPRAFAGQCVRLRKNTTASPRYHGRIACAARCRPKNSECCSRKRVWEKRRHRRGYTRGASFKTIASHAAFGAGKDRARFNEACAARTLDRLESLVHLARTSPLLCAKAGL